MNEDRALMQEKASEEAKSLRKLADQIEDELVSGADEAPSIPLIFRMVKNNALEISLIQKTLEGADARPAFIQWWESCTPITRRMIIVLPFYIALEAILHSTSSGDVGITKTVVQAILAYLTGG